MTVSADWVGDKSGSDQHQLTFLKGVVDVMVKLVLGNSKCYGGHLAIAFNTVTDVINKVHQCSIWLMAMAHPEREAEC